jgi:hypothetical protein
MPGEMLFLGEGPGTPRAHTLLAGAMRRIGHYCGMQSIEDDTEQVAWWMEFGFPANRKCGGRPDVFPGGDEAYIFNNARVL